MWRKAAVAAVLTGGLALGSVWSAAASAPDAGSLPKAPALRMGQHPGAPAPEPATAAPTSTAVSLSLPTQVDVGDPVAVQVQVQPAAVRDVSIQVRSTTHGWQTVASLRTDGSGAGGATWKADTSGDYGVRALAPATRTQAQGVSETRTVTAKYGLTVPTDQLDPLVPGRLTIRKHAASSRGWASSR